jgi:uncharacterized protein YodC (DUF2158 family)
LALVFCGCELNGLEQPEKPKVELRFEIGDVVDLKIGGQGQVIQIYKNSNRPYEIRIRTDAGLDYSRFKEFELEISL